MNSNCLLCKSRKKNANTLREEQADRGFPRSSAKGEESRLQVCGRESSYPSFTFINRLEQVNFRKKTGVGITPEFLDYIMSK